MDKEILIFRLSDLTHYYDEEELGDEFQYVPEKISELVANEPGIIAFFPINIWRMIFGVLLFPGIESPYGISSVEQNGIRLLPLLRFSV